MVTDGEAVEPGHHDVHENDVRREAFDISEHIEAACGHSGNHLLVAMAEVGSNRTREFTVIISYQKSHGC